MGLFNFKKKEEKKSEAVKSCCCGNCSSVENDGAEGSAVKILGSGCQKCNQMEGNVKQALEQLGKQVKIEHVKDFEKIAAYGVMSTPAVVVNEKVVCYGKVLKVNELVDLLANENI